MKFPKSKLDEMQTEKITKLESIGFWAAILSLLVSFLAQILTCEDDSRFLAEFILLEGLCVYMVIGSLVIGVWDRYMKANRKNNLLICFSVAVFEAVFVVLMERDCLSVETMKDALIFSGGTFAATFAFSEVMRILFRIRRRKLDGDARYRDLADRLGVTGQTLKAIEDGTYIPSIRLCRDICRATGKTLDEVFAGEKITLPISANEINV